MPISGRFFTSAELQDRLNTARQNVNRLAKTYNWSSPHPGLYDAADVDEYLFARARKSIQNCRDLIWDDSFDIDCPQCGAFALQWPVDDTYKCVNGHIGNL